MPGTERGGCVRKAERRCTLPGALHSANLAETQAGEAAGRKCGSTPGISHRVAGVSDLGNVGPGELAAAGSHRHLQLYVNQHAEALDARVRESFPELSSASFDWRSPLASDGYREYWNRAFLEAVDQGQHADALAQFWPRGGPHWDGLAVVAQDARPRGMLLVEA